MIIIIRKRLLIGKCYYVYSYWKGTKLFNDAMEKLGYKYIDLSDI